MKPNPRLRSFLAAIGGSILAISSASAADTDGYWTLNNNGNWSAVGNWSGGNVADGIGYSAYFQNVISSNRNITLDGDRTIGNIYAQDTSHNYSIIGTSTLTLDASSGQSILDVVSGRTLTISAPLIINDGIQKTGDGAVTIGGAVTLGSSQTWQVDAGTATFNGIIGDGGNVYSITKTGAGRLDFGGVNHTFSGGLTINGGEVQFRKNDNGSTDLGLGAGNLTINGGVAAAYWTYTFSRALGTGAGEVQITGGVSGFGGNGNSGGTFSLNTGVGNPAISWGDPTFNPSEFVLQYSGANTNGKSTFTNHLDLNGDDPGATPVSGTVWRTIRSDQNNAVAAGGFGQFSGGITNSGTTNLAGLIKTGIGQHVLSGANTYDGGTQVNEGTLTVTAPGALPDYDTSGKVTVASDAMLAVRTNGWTAGDIDTLRANATWSATSSQLGFDTNSNFTYASDITEALSVTKFSGSTLTLSGNNSYTGSTTVLAGTLALSGNNTTTGTTTIAGGTLRADSANALGSGDITFAGGTLQYTAGAAGSDFGGQIVNSTSAMNINTNGVDVSISGIDGTNTGGLTKSGAGTLTLTGTNTYGGITTLDAGTIAVYDGTLNTSGQVKLKSNTSISILGGSGVNSTWNVGNQQFGTENNNYTNIQVTIDGDGVAGSALLTNVNNLVFGRTASFSDMIVTDGGQVNVNGDIRIGDTYYNTGGFTTLTIGGGTATSTVTGNNTKSMYVGFGERENAHDNTVTVTSGGVLTGIGHMVVGHVNNAQGNDNPATANKLTVTGTGTASMQSLSVGYVQSGATPGWEASANVVEVTNGGTFSTLGGTSYIGRSDAVNGSISNSNTATVTGAGSSWNAGGQNIYVGYTGTRAASTSNNNILTVDAGATMTNVNSLIVGDGSGTETGNELALAGGSVSATSVSVSADNILSGSGSITGNTSIAGTLEIGVNGGTADLIAITGDLDISAATLNVVESGSGATLGSYTIVTYTGTLTDSGGTFGTVNPLPSGYSLDFSTAGQIKLVSGGAPTGFDGWKLTGSLGTVTFDGDTNGDGVQDGLAFLLGALDPDVNAIGLLPTATEDGSGNLVLTFDMLDSASRGTATLSVEHSSDLGISDAWTTVAVPDTSGGPTSGVTFVVSGSGTLDVTATIQSSQAAGGKLFGRLKATE